MKDKWEEMYSKNFGGQWYPSEGFVVFSARYLKRRLGINVYQEKKDVNRILDAGCGIGRHIGFFAHQGYDVYGMDLSKEAIDIAQAWLYKQRMKANLIVGDLSQTSYDSNFFDVIVSLSVLDHVTFSESKIIINEFNRILKPGGYLFVSLRSTYDSEYGRGEKVDNNSFILEGGYEDGILQHYFDLDEINGLLHDFKIFDIELREERFSSRESIDNAYEKSSGNIKKYYDLAKGVDFDLKYSRFFIAAEK